MRAFRAGWTESKLFSTLYFLMTLINIIFLANSVSQESKQQILQPLSVLRPKFRVSLQMFPPEHVWLILIAPQAVAQSLRDIVRLHLAPTALMPH